jgi:cathepsin B
MKSAFIASLVAFANAGKVHEFFAETNLICSLCKDYMGHLSAGRTEEINDMFTLFPALKRRVLSMTTDNNVDFSQPEQSCINLELCEGTQTIEEMLMNDRPIDLEEIANKINSNPNSTWTARMPTKFEGKSRAAIKKMMGTVVDPQWVIRAPELSPYNNASAENQTIPTNFDAQANWGGCPLITWARDQSDCGSCWAHGTTEAFNDRYCIATNGSVQQPFSVADTAGCCSSTCLSFDCNGGQVATPWKWFKNTGVVSGGGYGNNNFCYAYTMPECAHHVTS